MAAGHKHESIRLECGLTPSDAYTFCGSEDGELFQEAARRILGSENHLCTWHPAPEVACKQMSIVGCCRQDFLLGPGGREPGGVFPSSYRRHHRTGHAPKGRLPADRIHRRPDQSLAVTGPCSQSCLLVVPTTTSVLAHGLWCQDMTHKMETVCTITLCVA